MLKKRRNRVSRKKKEKCIKLRKAFENIIAKYISAIRRKRKDYRFAPNPLKKKIMNK